MSCGIMTPIGPFNVPAVNSTANNTIRDVVGNKDDEHNGTSIISVVHTLEEHAHHSQFVAPDLADAVSVTANAPSWEISAAFVEIIANGLIGSDFDLHYVSLAFDANDEYQLNVYAVETLIASVEGERNTNQVRSGNIPMQCPIQPAGTQIQVKLACKSTNANSATVKFQGHMY